MKKMFQSLKVVGICVVLLGVECSDAMQVEEQGQSNGQQKVDVEVVLSEGNSSELTGVGNTENSEESPLVTEGNAPENPEQEVQTPEEAISENESEDPTDTGVVLSDPEEIILAPGDSAEEVNPIEEIPTEAVPEPENIHPSEEIQKPEESTPGEVDLGEPITAPEIINPIGEIPTGSNTEVEDTVPSIEEESPAESATEIDEIDSGTESGSESECNDSISVKIIRVFTAIKEKSIGFLKRIFNLFF